MSFIEFKHGFSRFVILIGPLAIKIAKPHRLCLGGYNNWIEPYRYWTNWRGLALCPCMVFIPIFITIMLRCKLADESIYNTIQYNDNFGCMDLRDRFGLNCNDDTHERYLWYTGDLYPSNFGWIAGKLFRIDYGHPARTWKLSFKNYINRKMPYVRWFTSRR
ncbi:hypothetical protein D3C72_1305740 [compost metagenome]